MTKRLLGMLVCAFVLATRALALDDPASAPSGADSASELIDSSHARAKAVTAADVHFVGNVSYQFSGTSAELKADQVQDSRTSGTTGTLKLVLWASATRGGTGYLLAEYQMGQLAAGQSFYNVDSGSVPFAPPPNGTWYITMYLEEYNGAWYYTDLLTFDNTQTWPRTSCTPDSTNLCLSASRFRVSVNWQAQSQGTSGVGTALSMSSDTGYFWFFNSSNVELVVKVLDGRTINGYFWVFYGALSDVAYTITVTDTQTGRAKIYTNPSGRLASSADTLAFAASGTAQNANVTGTWDAALTVGSTQTTATLTLIQTGTSVTGTAAVVGGAGGVLSGTIAGHSFTFTITALAPCAGSFNGFGTVDPTNSYMTGSYSGSDCGGALSATFTATRR